MFFWVGKQCIVWEEEVLPPLRVRPVCGYMKRMVASADDDGESENDDNGTGLGCYYDNDYDGTCGGELHRKNTTDHVSN